MAQEARFCIKCGAQLRAGVKFCQSCGAQVSTVTMPQTQGYNQPVPQTQRQSQSAPQTQGNNQPAPQTQRQSQSAPQTQGYNQPAPQTHGYNQSAPQPQGQNQSAHHAQVQSAVQGQVNKAGQPESIMKAPSGSGMFSFDMEGVNAVREIAKEILTPLKAVADIIPRVFSNLKNVVKNPLALIPIIVLSVLWIMLNSLRRSGNAGGAFIRILSWICYGGYTGNRTLLGVVGTSVGRGVVALGYSSLLTGGIGKIKSGFNAMTSRQEAAVPSMDKRSSIAWTLIGAGAALIINRIIAGAPSWSGEMAVIAAAAVSLQSFGNRNGYLYGIARSLTSTVVPGGGKTEDKNAIKMLMTGFSAGFICMIVYTAVKSLLGLAIGGEGEAFLSGYPLAMGVILLIIGMIMVFSDKKSLTVMGDN